MKLKNRFLSIFAVFAFCVAATSAWAGQRTLESGNGGYYINMPQSGTDTLIIGSGVSSFEIPECGEACEGSVLVLIAPEGKHIQLIDGYDNLYDDGRYYRGDLKAFDGAHDNPIADDAAQLYGNASYGETLTIVSTGITDVKTVAHIINGNTSHKVTVENSGSNCSGSVSSGALNLNSVTVGSPVTLTVNPEEGCALRDAYVKIPSWNDTSLVPIVGGSWFAGNELSFMMPYVDVNVVVNYVKKTEMTAANRVSVTVPRKNSLSVTIPDGVKSFNVVQKKPVNNGILVLTAPENMKLQISGCTYGESSNEILKIYDGANTSATELLSIRSGSVDVLSSGNTMTLLVNGEYVIGDLTVELVSSNAGYAAVNYIDANGTEQELSPTQYTVLSSNIEPVNGLINLPGGWYVVNGNVAFSNPLLFDGETHIVLADGAEMRVNVWDDYFENSEYWDYGRNSAVVVKNRLAVYGQSLGSGSLIVESAGSGNYEYSVFAYDGIAINGGHVTIDGNITAGRWNDESFVVNGGVVNIHGVYAYNITLDWHKTTDTIVAESFYQPTSGSSTAITIANGKAFKDKNGKVYRGAYEQFTLLSGKTLTPCYAVSVDLQDGSPVTDLAVTIGESFQRPDNPTRAGATFLGWYTSADGDTEFDFSAPITGNTVMYAKWEQDPVKYIDENGEEQSVSKYIVLSTGVSLPSEDDGTPYLPSGWYVVENSNTDPNSNGGVDLLMDGYINAHGDVHLILADGAEMKVTGGFGLYEGNLTVYGQVNGTGALNVSSSIWGYYNLTINGGRVTAEGGVHAGMVTINGGYVKADKDTRTGIDCYNFVMNGGSVSLGYIDAQSYITLGWRNTTDYITVQFYYSGSGSRKTSIVEGKSFKDENGEVYSGALSVEQNTAIRGKKLVPNVLKSLSSEDIVIADILNQEYTGSAICPDITIMDGEMKLVSGTHYTVECSDNVSTGNATATITGIGSYMDEVTRTFEIVPMKLAEYAAVQILEDQNGKIVAIDGEYTGRDTVNIPDPVEVDSIQINREFTAGVPSTIVLPFTLPEGTKINAKFYYLKKIVQDGCSWRATMKYIGSDNLPQANTPYAIILDKGEETLAFDLNEGEAILQTGPIAENVDETDKWIFKGVYSYKQWAEGDTTLGLAYGLAGRNEENISKGEFGRISAGAYIYPMRSYLTKRDASVRLECPAAVRAWDDASYSASFSSVNTDVIGVEFVDENEKTTAVGRLNTATGEFKIDRWYDLKGRKVNNVNRAAKGAYYGKRTIGNGTKK